jgi:dihydropyrimidinase
LTDAVYERPDAGLYVAQPPIRRQEDVDALWAGLFDGTIDTIGSDHVGWVHSFKLDPAHTLTDLRPGTPDLELVLPLLHSEGVVRRGMPLRRMVELTSANAARLMKVYPRKGTIQVGSDGDLVVFDPSQKRAVDSKKLQSRAGYSPFEGMELTGWPKVTVRGGKVVFRAGKVLARKGSGGILRTGGV